VPLVVFFIVYIGFLNTQNSVAGTFALNFFGNFLWYFFLIVLPIFITIAILRSRLFDIDVIIRAAQGRTLFFPLTRWILRISEPVCQFLRKIPASKDRGI